MASVEIEYSLSDGQNNCTRSEEFDADSTLLDEVNNYAESECEDLNVAQEDEDGDSGEWECIGWEIVDWDTDYDEQQGPEEFNSLNEWGEYCEAADHADNRHSDGGAAYCVRYADIGNYANMEGYSGCWSSWDDYVRNYVDDCMCLDESAATYFDYDKFGRDLQYDYSVYEEDSGVYIFSDH